MIASQKFKFNHFTFNKEKMIVIEKILKICKTRFRMPS